MISLLQLERPYFGSVMESMTSSTTTDTCFAWGGTRSSNADLHGLHSSALELQSADSLATGSLFSSATRAPGSAPSVFAPSTVFGDPILATTEFEPIYSLFSPTIDASPAPAVQNLGTFQHASAPLGLFGSAPAPLAHSADTLFTESASEVARSSGVAPSASKDACLSLYAPVSLTLFLESEYEGSASKMSAPQGRSRPKVKGSDHLRICRSAPPPLQGAAPPPPPPLQETAIHPSPGGQPVLLQYDEDSLVFPIYRKERRVSRQQSRRSRW